MGDGCLASYIVGFPLSAEASLGLTAHIGFGIQLFGDLNPGKSFADGVLAIQVGWMVKG